MNNPYNKYPVLEALERSKIEDITLDAENFEKEYAFKRHTQPFIIKFISILGGILASLSFAGFVFLFNFTNNSNSILIISLVAIILTIWLNNKSEKIILSSFSVSCYIIGFYFLNFSLSSYDLPFNSSQIIIMGISILVLIFSKGYLLAFLSVVFFNISFQLFYQYFNFGPGNIFVGENIILITNLSDVLHKGILLLLILFAYEKEAKFLTYKASTNRILYPVRLAMVIFYIYLLYSHSSGLGSREVFPFPVIVSIIQLLAALFLINKIIVEHNFFIGTKKWIIIACLAIGLSCSIYAPGISGAILLMVLAFKKSDKTTLIISAVAFLFFLSKYYYDLELTLLTKSIMLFCSGVLFFIIQYLLTSKKIENEKI